MAFYATDDLELQEDNTVVVKATGQCLGPIDDLYQEVGGYSTPSTPVEFANQLQKLVDSNLVIDVRAIPALTAAVAICQRDGCLHVLIRQLERLCFNKRDRVTLYPDGQPAEMSFGILWHKRPLLWGSQEKGDAYYGQPRDDAKAFMVGGLIYRGPERGYEGQPHSWSVHT